MTKPTVSPAATARKKKKFVKQMTKFAVSLHDLKMLCLDVDYRIDLDCRDEVEGISVKYAKRFNFDTHEFRHELADAGVKGAV